MFSNRANSMAKQVSVTDSQLGIKTFKFEWNTLLFIRSENRTSLNPENPGTLLKWSIDIGVTATDVNKLTLNAVPHFPSDEMHLRNFKVFAEKGEKKMKIYNGEGVMSSIVGHTLDIPRGTSSNVFGMGQLTLMFEVDEVNRSEDNVAQLIAGVSLQDPLNNLTSCFTQLFESKQCSNVTLSVGDFTIKAHKAVLIARSPVFAAMFEHDMQEQKLNSISITDIDPEVLEEMLRYMYTDNAPHLKAMAEHLLIAADKYALPNLKFKSEQSLLANISIQNAANTLMLADRHNAEHLKAKTLKYIAANASMIMETQGWKDMLKSGSNIELVGEVCRALALK